MGTLSILQKGFTMSIVSKEVIAKLESAGYKRLEVDTDYSRFRVAHCIYVVLEDDAVYFHSARAPMSALKKFQGFMGRGQSKRLPTPIQNYINWTFVQRPNLHVVMYYKSGTFINHKIEADISAIRGVDVCLRKPNDRSGYKNIYRFSLKGTDGYMLVSSKDDIGKASSAWLTRASQNCMATHKANNVAFRDWCRLNALNIRRDNLEAEMLAEQLVPGADKMFIGLYVEKHHEHNLNMRVGK